MAQTTFRANVFDPSLVRNPDFNTDGKTDILWQHNTSGMVTVCYMDNATRTGAAAIGRMTDLSWKIPNR